MTRLLLVLEHDEQLEKVVKYLWRVGMTNIRRLPRGWHEGVGQPGI